MDGRAAKAVEHQERHALAAMLAAELEMGEQCPVCGRRSILPSSNIESPNECR